MQKFNLAILFFAISTMMLLVYYGCKKDKSEPIENSNGTIDMTVNGAVWSPETLYASKIGDDMIVYGSDENGKEFSIKLSSVSTGSFVIGEDNGSFFSDGKNNYRTGDLGTDTIVIFAFENNTIEGSFDLLLIKEDSNRDTSGYVQLKGNFHVEQFFNNPYGWDRGKVTFYKTEESCSETEVRINMFYKGGASNGTPIAGPPPYLRFSFSGIPECEYGGYNLDMPPLSSRSGFDFRILRQGEYSIHIVAPDDNLNWTKIIGEDVIKIEKQKCLLYEVKCDTGNMIKVITKPVTEITENSAKTGGEISYNGNDPINITSRGVEYVAINPNYGESHTDNGSGLGQFTSNLTDLHSATEYKVRAYCYDFERGRYYYGDWILFQTTGGGSGNESSFTIDYDGTHSGSGYDFISYDGQNEIVFSIPEINTHINVGAYGGFILGTQSSVFECLDNMAPPIQIMVWDFNLNTTLWSVYGKDCPYGSPGYICSNATVVITLLTENHIVGSFSGTVHSSEIPPLINKPISGSFNIFYNTK